MNPRQTLGKMKNPINLILMSAMSTFVLEAETTTILLDFGNDDSFRGASVVSPDKNGNHWNSVRPGLFFAELVDTTGVLTTLAYGPGSHPTDSYNGPAGDTTLNGPSASAYDAVALGALGVDEAVYDYHVGVLGTASGYFQIENLNPEVSYTLRFYGAHKYIAEPDGLTTYRVYSDAERTVLLGEVDLGVGSIGDAHNENALGVLTGLSPAAEVGIFYIEFGGADGVSDGYINAMSISYTAEVIEPTGEWAGYPVLPSGDVDTGGFLGWINVSGGDFVWVWSLGKYIYMPEPAADSTGAWGFVSKN